MAQINNCTIGGHLTKDVEIKGEADKKYTQLSIGVNRGYGDKKQSFFTVIFVSGKIAEWCVDGKKGDYVLGSGLAYNVKEVEKDGAKKQYHGFETTYGSQVAIFKKENKSSNSTSAQSQPTVDYNDIPF